MIITKTPFRISFFGGGTDISDYFNEYGGKVISTTIDKFCYVTVRHLPRFFEYHDYISYSIIEKVKKIDDIRHPVVRNAMKHLNMHELSIIYDADLPARTGLGTSSSFAAGLLLALYSLKGQYIDKKKLASDAILVERKLCNEAGGWQDQVAASFGGLNTIDFKNDDFSVSPLIISAERKKELEDNLMLFFTGFSRLSSDIHGSIAKNRKDNIDSLKNIYDIACEAERVLTNKRSDLDEIGRMLDLSWKYKRNMGKDVTTDAIDVIYEEAISAGAIGGKILGAGGGGFLMFYVPRDKQVNVMKKLDKLQYIPFGFENEGSEVLYYRPEIYDLPEIYCD